MPLDDLLCHALGADIVDPATFGNGFAFLGQDTGREPPDDEAGRVHQAPGAGLDRGFDYVARTVRVDTCLQSVVLRPDVGAGCKVKHAVDTFGNGYFQ